MFAGVAPRYDLLNHLLSLNIDKRWRRFTVRMVAPRDDQPILDVCTGTGDLALEYAGATRGKVQVVGADFCRPMLLRAAAKGRAAGANIAWLEADGQQLPFADNRFQIVAVAFGLRNISDTSQGITELVRVARPGGRVAILEFSRPRAPILHWLYLAYFKYLLPRIGQTVSRSQHEAYHYLPASVLAFPDGPAMIALLEQHGLREVKAYPLTFGIATLYVGVKPAA